MKHSIGRKLPLFLPAVFVLVLFGTTSAIGDTEVEKGKVSDPAPQVAAHPLPADPDPKAVPHPVDPSPPTHVVEHPVDPSPPTRVIEHPVNPGRPTHVIEYPTNPGPPTHVIEYPNPYEPIPRYLPWPTPPGPIVNIDRLCYGDGCVSDEEDPAPDLQQSGGPAAGQSGSTETPSSNSPRGDDDDSKKKKKSSKKRPPSSDSDSESDQAESGGQATAGPTEPGATHGITIVITSNTELNDEGELDITKSQLKDLVFSGIKGYVSLSSAVSSLQASLYRKVGDKCFLVYPNDASVDCSSYGSGRLHQLQDDGESRFAFRALQPQDGSSHSDEIKQLSERKPDGGFLKEGTYVFSVQVATTDGDTQTASYDLNVS